jgi:hypothetical protein
MNIITTGNFVAGIFAKWADAQHYLTLKPPEIKGFLHTNTDLEYPFCLLEMGDTRFFAYQTEKQARAQGVGVILYTIYEDFQPDHPWTDVMGDLEHEHLRNK